VIRGSGILGAVRLTRKRASGTLFRGPFLLLFVVPVVERWITIGCSFFALVGEEFLHQHGDFIFKEAFESWRVFLVDNELNAARPESH
jgi:hypothetical protein